MSEPRGQHYVPQVYLRSFADGHTIRVYRRNEIRPESFETNIKNIAKRRDVYSVQTDQGRDRYIDENFGQVEDLLVAVLVPVVQEHLLTEAQWDALKYSVRNARDSEPGINRQLRGRH